MFFTKFILAGPATQYFTVSRFLALGLQETTKMIENGNFSKLKFVIWFLNVPKGFSKNQLDILNLQLTA